MNKIPTISIVMSAYGVENYISDAIESVMNQNYNDWELIVVNDGSQDRTLEIAKEYEASDPRIVVLNKENGGLSDARNYGLAHAKGKYIHFFDADDYIDSDFYSSLEPVMSKGDYDFVVSGFIVDKISQNNVQYFQHYLFDDKNPVPAKFDLSLLSEYFNFAWNKLFSKQFLQLNGLQFQKGIFGYEDVEFMSRAIKHNPSFCFIRYSGYHYVNRNRQTLSRVMDDSIVERSIEWQKSYNTILHYFCQSDKDIDIENERVTIVTYRSILNRLIDNNVSFAQAYDILSDARLFNLLKPSVEMMDFEYKAFDCLLKMRLYRILFMAYKIKKHFE